MGRYNLLSTNTLLSKKKNAKTVLNILKGSCWGGFKVSSKLVHNVNMENYSL